MIQRYIFPYNNQACTYRIEFSVPDSVITAKPMRNIINVFGNKMNESSFSSKILEIYSNEERFFNKNPIFESENEIKNESIRTQMETLKKIIETDDNTSLIVSFIAADFLQDSELNWYFISLENYRYEMMLPKISSNKTKIRKLKFKLPHIKSLPEIKPSLNMNLTCNPLLLQKEVLTQEILRDLLDDTY